MDFLVALGPLECVAAYCHAARKSVEWHSADVNAGTRAGLAFTVLSKRGDQRPAIYESESVNAVGSVRLHNRAQIEADLRCDGGQLSDLAICAQYVEHGGAANIKRIIGEFGFVWVDSRAGIGLVACDAFSLSPLYYRQSADLLLVTNRAANIADSQRFDRDFIAEFLVVGINPDNRTIYEHVHAVPPGSYLLVTRESVRVHKYWSIDEFGRLSHVDERETTNRFRDLIADAVGAAMSDRLTTFAQLSGGLDSSSIVSTAALRLTDIHRSHGLQGTVTYTDSLGHADERIYSDAVVDRTGIRNHVLPYGWMLEDDGTPPPATDLPTMSYAWYARERRLDQFLRQHGAQALLSGEGSDLYLTGDLIYTADLMAAGHIGTAVNRLLQAAMVQRQSFWKLCWKNAILPNIGGHAQELFGGRSTKPPAWLPEAFVERFNVGRRLTGLRRLSGPSGKKFAGAVQHELSIAKRLAMRTTIDGNVEFRYPFLYRPLVEFALTLPPEMLAKPGITKWILRQSMRGILPDSVRQRTGKGAIGARVVWALNQERSIIRQLLRESILVQLGCVDYERLRRVLRLARRGEAPGIVSIIAVITLEFWLNVRSGLWKANRSGNVLRAAG
jgi:asparagine synthase (glutamine-hydrolysing)